MRNDFNHVKPLDLPLIQQVNSPEGRYYLTPEGNFPSVTRFLSFFTEDAIQAWKEKVGEEEAERIGKHARERGTRLHTNVENYLNNVSTREYKNFLEQVVFAKFMPILDRIDNIHLLERQLFSSTLQLAGTVDCIAEFDGVLSVIDFKGSAKEKSKDFIESYFLQGTIYSIMFEEMTGIKVPNVVILIACDDSPPQVFKVKRKDYYENLSNKLKLWRNHHEQINA